MTTCEWARNLLEPDGSFAGSEGSIAGFYKAPHAFATAGFVREAEAVTKYIRRHFFANGDSNRGRDGTSLDSANYFNAWLCWGTHTIGAYDLAYPGGGHLERVQHPDLGGIPECPKPSLTEQEIEWGATASAAWRLSLPQNGLGRPLEDTVYSRRRPHSHHRVWQARSVGNMLLQTQEPKRRMAAPPAIRELRRAAYRSILGHQPRTRLLAIRNRSGLDLKLHRRGIHERFAI